MTSLCSAHPDKMIEHSKKMNTFFFMAALHLKGSTPVRDIGAIVVSTQYPFSLYMKLILKMNLFDGLLFLRSIKVKLICGKAASSVLCPGIFILSGIGRTLFTVAYGG